MRTRCTQSLLLAPLIFSTILCAQTAKKDAAKAAPKSEHPDLSGLWLQPYQPRDLKNPTGMGTASPENQRNREGQPVPEGQGFLDLTMEKPQMLPWAQKFYDAVLADGHDPYIQPEIPVEPRMNCIPAGIPSVFDGHNGFELIHLPDRVLMLFERGAQHRQIWMDGRKHPGEGAPLFFMGHSIGWWEGDTLVVDTVDINPLNWIDRLGHPQTDALHVVERYRRTKPNWLEIEFLFDDPKAYKKPWKGKKIFFLQSTKGGGAATRTRTSIEERFICENDFLEEYPKKVKELIGVTAELPPELDN